MASVGRRRSIQSSRDQSSRDNSLAAPGNRATSKGPASSTVSLASSDNPSEELRRSTDGAIDRLKSRNSEDGRSDTSSSHRRRMSRLFKGRKKRTKSGSPDDVSPLDSNEHVPPVPDIRLPSGDLPNHSQESLGLAKSVTSSLLTEDSDSEASPIKRPGISPHQSHAGLLTLSSPLITSETIDSVDAADVTLVNSVTTAEEGPVRAANTIDSTANKRGASPVGKLKEAFAPTRRNISPKKPGGDADGPRPKTSESSLGALFGGKKRETRALEEPFQASPPQIHTGPDTQSKTSLRSTAPKRIITQIPATPPNLHDAPTTLVTPPTPTDAKATSPADSIRSKNGTKHTTSQSNPNIVVSPSGNMISHRRVRSTSNAPSKLSHSTTLPLTPHLEEAKTPGGTAVHAQSPGGPGGFFASIFSAAQNAATNLTDTIANSAPGKNTKTNQQQQKEEDERPEDGGEEVIGPENADSTENSGTEKRRPAVETLGSGNLSLAQLGIAESNEVSPMSSVTNVTMKADEASANVEDIAAAHAVSAAYVVDKPPSISSERPRSITANAGQPAAGAASPQRQNEITDSPAPSSVQRQGSIRSRLSDSRRRRHRGSSATTGNAIGAAISASTATLVPNAALNGSRLNGTGFAVASSKRNRDFHNLFKSVPEDDYLIEDYSAALQKEILLHGRLYVSEGHLCFSSNILGWVTNLVISFDEVVSVEKKSTAMLFPNAIVISTLHARNVFASFLTRDATYDLIIGIWKISHPNLKSSLNGVTLDGSATGDKTEKADSIGSEEISDQDSDDEVYDEDAEEDDGMGSFTEAGEGSVAGSEMGSLPGDIRKLSGAVAQAVGAGSETVEAAKAATSGATTGQDFPGSTSHAPTECGDADQHYDKLLIDTTIPAPLGKVYSLMFGPASGVFMRKWLVEDQKSSDLQMEDDKKGLGEDRKSFSYSYIKPLSAPVGPRQTKCNISMALEQFDLEKVVSVQCSTGTPDVPSGNIFLTKTRYCLMWGPGNSTRLIMTFTVEWNGKSWLRVPIEKGANDGQMSYATALTAALRTAVAAKAAPLRVPGKGGKSKKRSRANVLDDAPAPVTAPTPASQVKQSNWGLLDPLRSLLGPVADILELLFTPQIIITVLGALLIYSWFFRGASIAVRPNQLSNAQRQVAYEEIWRHEETELWKWLEDRVALDRVHTSVAGGRLEPDPRLQSSLSPENMKERQMDEAIKVTEERLGVLKNAVNRERSKSRTKSPKEEQT
ncbi:GRAM domain-containing protein [Cucurbitaria berberidis CBS 394.84]|uniref:GRAM domain-containing protein n=1 Tax=Cucurbitaria berberidis CBS 394.84 TaxID=1168544 RepID=A0A9P4GL98_9PLEO|nr:GRAM domain-containing protein [Cucurbitaria berberidis CBS 394.84]KAF1847529.1 GRAM domain-containing protein [Cucurbitaria berberidis CBS 394.84]